MKEYPKILTIYERDPANLKHVIPGKWASAELAHLADAEWDFTEKIDGTNVRVMWDGHGVKFGGKTDEAQIQVQLLYRLNDLFDGPANAERFAATFGETAACLYGEGYGGRIQKVGPLYGPTTKFILFDVRVGEWWLQRADVENVASKMGLDVVPIIGWGTLTEAADRVRGGIASERGELPAEGIVARPKVDLYDRKGQRIIGKIKARDLPRA